MRIVVHDWDLAILYRDGRYAGPLPPGAHWFLGLFEHIEVRRLRRLQWIQAANVDAVTRDRFPLRLSLGAMCEVRDARAAYDGEFTVRCTLVLSAAAAQAAATLSLDELVVGRQALADTASGLVGDTVPGCALSDLQITGVTLPPEVRRLLTDSERARREGEAALERARAEHAALRALANAARMLKGNPELMNLRLLQAVGAGPRPATLVLHEGALAPMPDAAPP